MSGGDVDLQANATLEMTQVLSAIRALAGGIKMLDAATLQLNKSQQDYASKAGKTFKELGALIGKIPGLGGLKEIFDHAQNGSALFARLGVALSVAGIAFGAYSAVVQANINRVKSYNEALRQTLDMTLKVRDAQDQQAKAGLAQNTTSYRKAVGLGGQGALDAAKKLQASGNFTNEEALKAVGKLIARFGPGKATNEGLSGLANGSKVGLDLDDMLDAYTRAGTSMGIPGQADNINSVLFSKDRAFGLGQTNPEAYRDALARSRGDAFQNAAAGDAVTSSQIPAGQRAQAIATGQRTVGAEVADALAPGQAAQTAAFRELSMKLNDLGRLADAQGGIASAIANFGMIFGGEGSFNQQRLRLMGQTGNAQFGSPTTPVPYEAAPATPNAFNLGGAH